MNKIKTLEDAINSFITGAEKHALANETGDYKTGNKYYRLIIKSICYLYDNNATYSLIPLLDNPNVGVRLWAAYALLPFESDKAESVLTKVMNERSDIHHVDAKYTLIEWRKGTLKFPTSSGKWVASEDIKLRISGAPNNHISVK